VPNFAGSVGTAVGSCVGAGGFVAVGAASVGGVVGSCVTTGGTVAAGVAGGVAQAVSIKLATRMIANSIDSRVFTVLLLIVLLLIKYYNVLVHLPNQSGCNHLLFDLMLEHPLFTPNLKQYS
jgi:hypothetical protein